MLLVQTNWIKWVEVKVTYCLTKNMLADFFIKLLQGTAFRKMREHKLDLPSTNKISEVHRIILHKAKNDRTKKCRKEDPMTWVFTGWERNGQIKRRRGKQKEMRRKSDLLTCVVRFSYPVNFRSHTLRLTSVLSANPTNAPLQLTLDAVKANLNTV